MSPRPRGLEQHNPRPRETRRSRTWSLTDSAIICIIQSVDVFYSTRIYAVKNNSQRQLYELFNVISDQLLLPPLVVESYPGSQQSPQR